MHLLVTRPEPDASKQARALMSRGHDVSVEPLLEIEFVDGAEFELGGVQALVATSRNGLRALELMPQLTAARALPLLAVGPASAQSARALGFARVHEGKGTALSLLHVTRSHCPPGRGALLHLAGETLATNLKAVLEECGYCVRQPVLYRAKARSELSESAQAALRSGGLGGVILMSPRTAKIYRGLVAAAGLADALGNVIHFCLSEAVAVALGGGPPPQCRIAESPREDDLLALISREAADYKQGISGDEDH